MLFALHSLFLSLKICIFVAIEQIILTPKIYMMRLILMSLAFIVMSLNVQAKDSEAYNPSIKMGEGTVRITVDESSAASADSLTFELYYLPFFLKIFS